ncbi:MAG: aminotransferase class IV family protein [Saprospirales bacterium]|nr:aminotransferase class IV family protein [Saprospirales bacterium]
MIRFHAINGRLTDAAQASLHVNDLAILRGYGIFDFFLVKTGRPLFIEDYLDRFFNSAHLMELDLPVSRTGLHEKILEVIEANKLTEGAIRLLLTGGYAEDSFTPQSPNWLVLAHDLKPHKQELFTAGGKLLLQQFQREFPMAKTINYGNALRMRKKITEADAHEALYHNGREVLESFRSNIFFVFDGPVLATPAEGILLGITRKHVLEMGSSLMPVEVRPISVGEIRHAREAFLTGSNKPILPVIQIGEHQIGDGKVGRVTRQLMDSWGDYLAAAAK